MRSEATDSPRSRLELLLERPDAEVDLAEAALLVACEEYPGLDLHAYLSRLDGMGEELGHRVERGGRAEQAVTAINHYLFDEQGFRGNADEYYDARNSYLNEVLDRRTGIPITLSALYIALGRRAGVMVEGVGLPGHFVVSVQAGSRSLLVDPFHGGAVLTEKDCQARLDRIFSGSVKLEPHMLRRCGSRDMVERILRNLKGIYLREQDSGRALRVLDLLIRIRPAAAEDVRDRGMLYAALDCYGLAAADLELYVARAPGAKDADELAARAALLRHKAARLN